MKEETKARIMLVAGLVFGAALLRLAPHPPNFAPVAAIALFGGARLGRRWLAFAIPFAGMLLVDSILQLTSPWGGFHATMGYVYGAVALIVCIGFVVGRLGSTPLSVFSGSLAGSVVFFIVTNFGHWQLMGMYPMTLGGLVQSYVAAIPFFGNQIAGDLFFSLVLFASFAWAERRVPSFAPARR